MADHSLRTIYLSCDSKSFYLLDRGGFGGEERWYGPLSTPMTQEAPPSK